MINNLAESLKISVQLNLPAIRVCNKTVIEVLADNEIFSLNDFTAKLGTKNPVAKFLEVYENHAFQKGFKTKRN